MSNQEIISGILNNSHFIFNYLERILFPQIKKLILLNSGNECDARCIYSHSLLIIYEKAANDELELNCSFATYFHSVCRNQWLVELRRRRKKHLQFDESIHSTEENINSCEEKSNEHIKKILFKKYLITLSKEDQLLIQFRMENISYNDIQKKLGSSNTNALRKRVHDIKKSLCERIQNDPEYRNHKNKN